MNSKKNKPLLLNSLEIRIINLALLDWKEPDHLREEKSALLNALKALEYIDEKDKYDPASVVVPPFERLPEGSCPNVHKIIESDNSETSYLSSIPKTKESIIEGLNTPISESIRESEIEW